MLAPRRSIRVLQLLLLLATLTQLEHSSERFGTRNLGGGALLVFGVVGVAQEVAWRQRLLIIIHTIDLPFALCLLSLVVLLNQHVRRLILLVEQRGALNYLLKRGFLFQLIVIDDLLLLLVTVLAAVEYEKTVVILLELSAVCALPNLLLVILIVLKINLF